MSDDNKFDKEKFSRAQLLAMLAALPQSAVDGNEIARAEIPLAEMVEQYDEQGNRRIDHKGRPVLKAQAGRTLAAGKNVVRVSGSTVVRLLELPDNHDSEMFFELRIEHPMGTGTPEVNRFIDEDTARAHFKVYVLTLAKQSGLDGQQLLEAPTVAGRIADKN